MAEVAKIAAIPVAHAGAYREAVVKAVTLLFLALTAANVVPLTMFPRSIADLPAPPTTRLTSNHLVTHISRFPSSVGHMVTELHLRELAHARAKTHLSKQLSSTTSQLPLGPHLVNPTCTCQNLSIPPLKTNLCKQVSSASCQYPFTLPIKLAHAI
eukprot:1147827-Pelagomonas_calceolata.AAC.2